ncbi:MAG: S8 family peptidase [Gammaproteobacteria bacterium]|nr:S8 family peptidase [Gammaproteobacteria bacterium]
MKGKYIYVTFGSFLLLLSSHFSMASEIIPNQYIVVFKDQQLVGQAKSTITQSGESVRSAAERLINEARQNQLLIQNRSGVQSSVTNELGSVYEHALKGFSAQLTPEAATYLSNEPEIDYVIPDQTTELHAVQVSPPAWGLDRIDQENLPLDQSYEYLTDGTAVHAYIIDTGIRANHNEFTGRIGNAYDAMDNDNNPVDCNGHGTHVAGTVAGTNYGVAKNVVIHPVRVFGCGSGGSFSDTIGGINWILANLQLPAVANMSLGGGAYAPVDTAVNNLINAGVTTVISAGNDYGGNACNKSPARVQNAITVASSTISDQRSSFSNIGSCVDIIAPGSSIRSAWYTTNTATAVLNGTSMSAPHVAGVVALYLEENTASTPAQVSNVITANATENRISNAGAGTPNRLLFSQLTEVPPPEEFDLAWLIPVINLILF